MATDPVKDIQSHAEAAQPNLTRRYEKLVRKILHSIQNFKSLTPQTLHLPFVPNPHTFQGNLQVTLHVKLNPKQLH